MQSYPTIFNHALAPITAGPSSSNTSGPYRIGRITRQINGETPAKVVMDLACSTNYASTFLGSRSDLAFINGLLGKEPDDPGFLSAYKDAAAAGLSVSFNTIGWKGAGTIKGHRIRLTDRRGNTTMVTADSTGGGTIKVMSIDGCSVTILGDQYELLVFTEKMGRPQLESLGASIAAQLTSCNSYTCSRGRGKFSLINIKSSVPINKDFLLRLPDRERIRQVRVLEPVHSITWNSMLQPPFTTPEEMVQYIDSKRIEPWEAAIDYEASLSGWSKSEVMEFAQKTWDIAKQSIAKGMESQFDMNGILTPKAMQLSQKFGTADTIPMGVLDICGPIALGIMEYSNSSGIIVCMPTGGASGIVPACIYGTGAYLKIEEKRLVKALLVAGLLGVFLSRGNNFSGGELGCQAEIGCATAMAAGALVQIMNGSAQQICDAGSMALQCLLGLVCDPVAGVVQIPCLARNMGASAIAVMSANAVLAGFEVGIPFEEMSEALKRVGKIVCRSHEIGSATTPTGRRMKKEQVHRDRQLRSQYAPK